MNTNKYYISSFTGQSGISKYARDFYRLVLQDSGYVHLDSAKSYAEILSIAGSKDEILIEIGIFQTKEIEILMRMIRAKYENVSVTLHDPPLIKYPFYKTGIPALNKFAKFYDLHWDNFARMIPVVDKIKRIYVLSKRGRSAVKSKYHVNNVFFLPHVVDPLEVAADQIQGKGLFFLGFIGANKGVEYALKLHERILAGGSDIGFQMIGDPIGKEKIYFDQVKARYKTKVDYLGYVPDERLDDVLSKSGYAILPFRDYGYYFPFSGSILQAMKKGKLVFTFEVNAVNELIRHGETGFILSGNTGRDANLIRGVMENVPLATIVAARAQKQLLERFSPQNARDHFLLQNLKDTPGVFPGGNY